MAAILTVDQKVSFVVKLVDSAGNAARCDGPASVTVSNGTAEVVNVAADGLSGELSALVAGTGQVAVRVDADLGDGVRELIILGDYEVVAGEAVAGTVEFGAASPK